MLLTSSSMPESTVPHGHARGFLNQPHFYCIIVTWLTWLSGSSHLATSNRISLETAKCSELNPFRETDSVGAKSSGTHLLGVRAGSLCLKELSSAFQSLSPKGPLSLVWALPYLRLFHSVFLHPFCGSLTIHAIPWPPMSRFSALVTFSRCLPSLSQLTVTTMCFVSLIIFVSAST